MVNIVHVRVVDKNASKSMKIRSWPHVGRVTPDAQIFKARKGPKDLRFRDIEWLLNKPKAAHEPDLFQRY